MLTTCPGLHSTAGCLGFEPWSQVQHPTAMPPRVGLQQNNTLLMVALCWWPGSLAVLIASKTDLLILQPGDIIETSESSGVTRPCENISCERIAWVSTLWLKQITATLSLQGGLVKAQPSDCKCESQHCAYR